MGKELLAIGAEDGELGDWIGGDGNDHVCHVDVSIVVQALRWFALQLRFLFSMVCLTNFWSFRNLVFSFIF